MIYANFYRGSGILAFLIRWWTKSDYAHCSVSVGGNVYEALGWRKAYPWWRGEVIRRPYGAYELEATEIECPWANTANVIGRSEEALTCSYDWPAVAISAEQKWFRGGFSLADKRTGAYDCSRFVQYALDLAFDGTPTPQDIYEKVTEKTNGNQ